MLGFICSTHLPHTTYGVHRYPSLIPPSKSEIRRRSQALYNATCVSAPICTPHRSSNVVVCVVAAGKVSGYGRSGRPALQHAVINSLTGLGRRLHIWRCDEILISILGALVTAEAPWRVGFAWLWRTPQMPKEDVWQLSAPCRPRACSAAEP